MPSVIADRVILDETDLNILEMALDQRVYPQTIEDLNAWIDLVDENYYNSPEERLLKAMAKQMHIDPSNPPEPVKMENPKKKYDAQIIEFKARP